MKKESQQESGVLAEGMPESTSSKENFGERIKRKLLEFTKGLKKSRELALDNEEAIGARDLPELNEVAIISDTAHELAREFAPQEERGAENAPVPFGRKLQRGESIIGKENPLKYLAAVRVSNNLPVITDGKLQLRTAFDETEGKVPRPTLHFTLNCRVANNDGGSWNDVAFAYVMPMDKTVEKNGKPYALGKDDTYWLVAGGLELPEGTKVIYRADMKEDASLAQLQEFCASQNLGIQFIENKSLDDDTITEVLKKGDYGWYGGSESPITVDHKLAEQIGTKSGGYAQHYNSWLNGFERTFMHGIPGYHPDRMRGNVALFHPFSQWKMLEQYRADLPPALAQKYENLVAEHLTYLTQGTDKVEEFSSERENGPAGEPGDAKKMSTSFYREMGIALYDTSDQALQKFWNDRPELKKRAEQLLDTVLVDPAFNKVLLELLDKKPEAIAAIAPKIFERVGYGAYALAEFYPQFATPQQINETRSIVRENPQILDQGMDEAALEFMISDIQERKDHFRDVYGEKFVNYFIEKYDKR